MNRKTTFLRWLLIVFAGLLFIGNSAFAQKLLISPDPIDLGDRPIGAWMEPLTVTLENTTISSLVINNVETDNPEYFGLDLPTFPVTIAAGETVEIGVSLQGTPAVGNVAGQLVIQFADATRDVEVAPMTVNAYVPQTGDVVENAFDLPVVPTAAAATPIVMGESTRAYNGFYKNYTLPNDLGSGVNDGDEVYKLESATDVLISFETISGTLNFAIYSEDFNGEGGPMANNALVQGVDIITDFELFAGTYYMVLSYLDGTGISATYAVTAMPAPEAVTNVAPLDGAVDIINGTDLEWAFGANTLEYQVILGTTYPPANVVVDWTDDLATTYELSNLEPNLQYFWQVNVRNNTTTTTGDIWGFTTTLTPPDNLSGNAEVYEGEDVVLTWESPVDRAFLGYNVYKDGSMINTTMVTGETYTDEAPAYNMAPGYEYTVTAIFDEGESDHSAPFTVQVTGEGTLNGNVSDLNTGDDIAGATVTMTGVDEFGEDQEYTTTTDASGNYTADVFAGTYDISVDADGYISAEVTGVAVAYGATETTDFTLFETAYPVAVVTASEFGENILIEWSFDAVNFVPQVYPFETTGMSELEIQKAWNGFLAENNFDATAQGSDRALVEFQVWREKSYLPGAFEMIGTTSQYQFVDFDWGLQDWGVYKWYVVAVYDLNESDPVGSNTIDNDMNTMVDVTVALNSAESPAGTLIEFTNMDESPELVYSTLLPASGEYTWNEFRRGTYDILVSLPGYGEITETGVDIFDETSFEWLLEEILAVPASLYVTPTGFATWTGGTAAPFSYFDDFEANDGGWVADGLFAWGTPAQNNIDAAYSGVNVWMTNLTANYPNSAEATLMKEFDFSDVANPFFSAQLFIETENNYDGMVLETSIDGGATWQYQDVAGMYNSAAVTWGSFPNQAKWSGRGTDYVLVQGYLNDIAGESSVWLRFRFKSDSSVNGNGIAIDDLSIDDLTPPVRSFETYKVFLDGTLLGEVTETEYQHGGFGETLVDGETYTTGVAAVFSTGQSATAEFTWLYVACDNYDAPSAFTAEQVIGTLDVTLNWTNVDAAALDTISALRIYRNGEELTELDFTAGAVDTYLDEELEFGTYNYCLTYIYDSGAETCVDAVCSEDVVITGGGYVNGTVTAFDGGAPISGATVTIFNDDYSFEFTTDVTGVYEGEVVDGTYDYFVEAATFEPQTLEAVTITFGETVTNDFQLLEFPYPVGNVVATELSDDAVQITWGEGGGGSIAEWLFYDDGTNVDGIGGPAVFSWAIKFDPAQLTDYAGASLTKIAIYNRLATADLLQIYEGTNAETLLHEQSLTGLPVEAWSEVDLTAAVPLDVTKELWITVYTTNGANYPAGCGPTQNQPNGDLITLDGVVWEHLSDYALPYTWNLRGYVTDMATMRTVELGSVQNTAGYKNYTAATAFEASGELNTSANAVYPTYAHESTRELVGYSIYRTTCETGELELLGFTLDEQFTDNTWGGVEAGVYKWGVVAEYDNNESEVVFSNCLDKDMITTVSVQVMTNSGDSPEETDVMFTNISEPGLELVYEVELDETGFYAWDEFRKGVYDIYVEKNGFAPIELMGYVIDGPQAFEWLLEELLLPVADLYVTPTGFATWRSGGEIPFEPFMENFDEGLPETWTIVDGGSTADTWFNTANYNGNSVDGTPFMFANSDAAGSSSTMNEQLISPVINAENADELYLMFDYVYQYIGNEYFAVDVMVDGEWVEVFRSEADSGPFPWGPTVNEMIDITEYANEELQVRFTYVSNSWNWYVAVDNVVVTDNMDRYADRALQYYKVWLDNNFIVDTENTFWQYDVTNLVPGQEYLAEVAAVYDNGISERMQYVWTYIPCSDYAGPQVYNVEAINDNDVLVSWSDVEPLELIKITQNPGAPANGYFQQYGYGYGVAYDLSAYPDALVNSLDFHHASWGTTGTWEYNIHIFDWDTKTLIETVGPITTTGNDLWEMGVELGDIATGGVSTVAILMEPLSNSPTDAYPDLSSDNATNPQGSIYGDLSNPSAIGSSTIGNFLMEMYIYTAYGPVRATPVNFDYVAAPAAQAKVAVNNVPELPVITQNAVNSREDDPFIGANIYRNGMLIAELVQDTFYLDENVNGGEYTYCLRYVYESGAMTCEDAYCLDVAIPCEAPENLAGTYVWNYNEGNPEFGSMITWGSSTPPVAEWLYYDDGTNVDGIGGPATFSWAIKFDPAQLADYDGASLTKIQIYNRTAASDELRIYEGTNAATLLHTQTLSGLGVETWEEVDLTDAVLIDVTKELWIVVYTTDGANYPAGCGPTQNEPNGDLITLDGVLWEHLSDYALPYTWNLRGYVTTAAGVTAALPMDKPEDTYSNDARAELTVSGTGAGENAVLESAASREVSVYNVYRSLDGEAYDLIATVPFDGGATAYEYFDTEVEAQVGYYYQVTALHTYDDGSECESAPAMAFENPEDNFVYVLVTNTNELGATEARMFPNPATDNVTIEAAGMNRITVINAVGQVVYDAEIDNVRTQFNVASFEAGVYMVRINTESGIATKRLTIVR